MNRLPNYIPFLEHWFLELRWQLWQIGLDILDRTIVAMQCFRRWLNSRTSGEVVGDRYTRRPDDRYHRREVR